MNRSLFSLLIVAVAMMSAATASAGGAYENALINLRSAHWLIDSHPKDWKDAPAETAAKNEITAAIGEIKKAGIDDKKELADHPKEIEMVKVVRDRLLKASAMLKTSREEITRLDESTPEKKHLKASSLAHINEALKNIDKIIAGGR